MISEINKKSYSRLQMALICWTLGIFGIHRLLMGYRNWWLQLISLGGFGIWMMIDFFRILLGKMNMADGTPLSKKS